MSFQTGDAKDLAGASAKPMSSMPAPSGGWPPAPASPRGEQRKTDVWKFDHGAAGHAAEDGLVAHFRYFVFKHFPAVAQNHTATAQAADFIELVADIEDRGCSPAACGSTSPNSHSRSERALLLHSSSNTAGRRQSARTISILWRMPRGRSSTSAAGEIVSDIIAPAGFCSASCSIWRLETRPRRFSLGRAGNMFAADRERRDET